MSVTILTILRPSTILVEVSRARTLISAPFLSENPFKADLIVLRDGMPPRRDSNEIRSTAERDVSARIPRARANNRALFDREKFRDDSVWTTACKIESALLAAVKGSWNI